MSFKLDYKYYNKAPSHKAKKRDFTSKCDSKKRDFRAGLESQSKIILETSMRLLMKSLKSSSLKQTTKHKRKRLLSDASHFESIINYEITAAMTTQVDKISESE